MHRGRLAPKCRVYRALQTGSTCYKHIGYRSASEENVASCPCGAAGNPYHGLDDSELTRRSLRTLLEGQDHWKVCDEASNGQEAVKKFSHEKFDIVVLDFQMPVMDGLEAARHITGRAPGTPILMVTSTRRHNSLARREG